MANELENLEEQLAEVLWQQEALQAKHDALWVRIFEALTRQGIQRYVCQDGMVLAREVAHTSPKLDEDKLRDVIYDKAPNADVASQIWRAVTVTKRIVDQKRLARAIKQELLSDSLVQEAIVPGRDIPRRVRRKANKEDRKS